MKNNMKPIMESWRRIIESEQDWNKSLDSDSSSKASLIVFREKDINKAANYPDDSGKNHGMISHANKHANEFGLNVLVPFEEFLQSTLKSGNSIYIRAGKSKTFIPIDLELFSKIQAKDAETRKTLQSQGSNMDIVYNSLFGDDKNKIVIAKTSIDFYHDIGDDKMASDLMGNVDEKYDDLAKNHHEKCDSTYTDQSTSKTWCVDDDALSISYGNKLSTMYKPKDIPKALSSDRTLQSLVDKLKSSNNEKEIENLKNKLKI